MVEKTLYGTLILSALGILFQMARLHKHNARVKWGSGLVSGAYQKGNLAILAALVNTLFQIRLFNASKSRWAVHFLVFFGFIYLFFFHALDKFISMGLFNAYPPTLDPFQFLRNLAGTLVFAGCLGFLWRRKAAPGLYPNKKTAAKGLPSILLILLIIVSGFMLEAAKIISAPVFMEMVETYSDLDKDNGIQTLEAYWADHCQVVFDTPPVLTGTILEIGRQLNAEFCLDCHSPTRSAFVSKALALALKKSAGILNHWRADRWLYLVHVLLVFSMLVGLPFSRLFHILLIPFTSARHQATQANFNQHDFFIHPFTFAACTNCGLCSTVCAVVPNFLITGNKYILPHFKLDAIGTLLRPAPFRTDDLASLFKGNNACTMCHRCTDICPAGIDLQGVWHSLSEMFDKTMIPGAPIFKPDTEPLKPFSFIGRVSSFENCVQCTVCTNVCPIVAYDSHHNDMTPQQVMNLIRLGQQKAAAETRMVSTCLTCYACQEHCPGEIKITDIMLELRTLLNQMQNRRTVSPLINKEFTS